MTKMFIVEEVFKEKNNSSLNTCSCIPLEWKPPYPGNITVLRCPKNIKKNDKILARPIASLTPNVITNGLFEFEKLL